MKTIIDSIKGRRSVYTISPESVMSDGELEKLVQEVAKNVPSPFNIQSQRVVLLLSDEHKKLWNIVLETLRKIVPVDKFTATEEKIASFAAGYGTILYLDANEVVTAISEKMPDYKDNFEMWAKHANGMMQYAMWTTLESAGFGASLQHYNPLIDDEVKKTWNLPATWTLVAQMPFGKPTAMPGEKEFMPIEDKVKIFK